ncbi:serine/threonine protein kinase [Sporothrix schenckii ATCC 58251]|uniref:Serine/threonine protein kinase n=1 Tax=Sporothrix schenckii (strain ATCC 58251 / de Perez 2211183) TaxID=1391915 RepID=U7PSN5_SPOS1|nr:serine/threonine protein kinase [Sporothrix schenckii ATCC 58251]
MAQPTSLPSEPQAGSLRTAPLASSVPPASPTKSIWKRLLNRSASAHPREPVQCPSAELPQSASPAVLPFAQEPTAQKLETSGPLDPARDGLGVGHDDQLPSSSNAEAPAADADGGIATKTSSNSRRAPHRDVVPGLPRAQTFARQQSELRGNLMPIIPTSAERRGVSADRRLTRSVSSPTSSQILSDPRTSAPNVSYRPKPGVSDAAKPATGAPQEEAVPPVPTIPSLTATVASSGQPPISEAETDDTTAVTSGDGLIHGDAAPAPQPAASGGDNDCGPSDAHSIAGNIAKEKEETFHIDTASMTSSQYEHRIRYELEHVWILNLSMHFRDKSRREKFFVTYRQRPDLTRRVTISLDYRNAPDGSLEMDLLDTKLQRDKNEMIYEAIRESLVDIQFYNTVTNLKLQTTDGRLHVHVVEDTTEIIDYPSAQSVHHLGCRKIRESDVEFDSHMSGFVYRVRVEGRVLIKKEIPGPDSVDEFLYEVNALNFLRGSQNVIELYGVIIGDDDRVRGLLISYAEQGALIDILYENNHGIPWYTRMKWARQIVHGLSEIHEAGFVQGDFTLSNIVIDYDGNAKIIDINRRGCPVGWEPPEATPLIQSDQRISMYIGVKSDLYQLGMVLWALATQEDDPEAHGRPLLLGDDVGVPQWYRSIVDTCLAEHPRERSQALQLLRYFPRPSTHFDDSDYEDDWVHGTHHHHPAFYAHSAPSGSVDDGSNSFRNRAAELGSVPSGDDHADDIAGQFIERERPDFVVDKFTSLTPVIRDVTPSNDWAYVNNFGHTYVSPSNGVSNESYYYPTRGRSPPRKSHSGYGRRDGSWIRKESLEQQTSAADALHVKQAESSPNRSNLPSSEPPALSELKDEDVQVGDEADGPDDTVDADTKESSDLEVVETVHKEAADDVAVDIPADDNGAAHTASPETDVQPLVIKASASNSSDAKSKDATVPSSPERPSECHYSLANGALAHEVVPLDTANSLERSGSDSKISDQIKGIGAVYADEKAFPRHMSLEHDEEDRDADDGHDANELDAVPATECQER